MACSAFLGIFLLCGSQNFRAYYSVIDFNHSLVLLFTLRITTMMDSDTVKCIPGPLEVGCGKDPRKVIVDVLTITDTLAAIMCKSLFLLCKCSANADIDFVVFISARILYLSAVRVRGTEQVEIPPRRPTVPAWTLATTSETLAHQSEGEVLLA